MLIENKDVGNFQTPNDQVCKHINPFVRIVDSGGNANWIRPIDLVSIRKSTGGSQSIINLAGGSWICSNDPPDVIAELLGVKCSE